MIKHILGQSLIQAFILFFFVFAGHLFVPESAEGPKGGPFGTGNTNNSTGLTLEQIASHPLYGTPDFSWEGDYVMNGMVQGFSGEDIYRPLYKYTPSRHLTMVFNVFVWFQVFNMLAARKINDELNIFAGVFDNIWFVGVWLFIALGQVFIVQYGSLAMKVHIAGLTTT